MGIHPTRNFTMGVNPNHRKLDSDKVMDIKIGDRACATCPLGCGNFTSINGIQVEGPEYETLCLGGSNCDINDIEQVMRFNRKCDDLGLDTISSGNVIGLAMALTEGGFADMDLKFGDAPAYLQVLDEMANRSTERGRDLCLGSAELAAKYGQPDQAAHSKGLEMPGYDPRGNYGIGLAYATSERGACHLRAFPLFADDPFKLKNLAKDVVTMQNQNGAKWSMCFCDFWNSLDTTIMADLLSAGLGRQVSATDLYKVGERIWNLIRMFNMAAGFTAEDDIISDKITRRALQNGPYEGRKLSPEILEELKGFYYRQRGWDENGRPKIAKLHELGLSDMLES
jgi:aldehyde:ferredoxin oxidoreductase